MNLTDIFLNLVDMSLSAAWVVLAVVVLRLVLKKAPKWLHCCLWLLVAVRLVCPISLETDFSLMPTEHAAEDMLDSYVGPSSTYWDITEEYQAAVDAGIQPIHGGEGHYYVVTGETSTTEVATVADYVAPIWAVGMAVMLVYACVSYLSLRRKVAASLTVGKGLYLCDYIQSPFILGIIRPGIYLPSDMEPDTASHVLAHERAHLKRRDHWWKPLGFLLLTVHWFNPVLWLAYVLLCRDIELACDEKVIKEMGAGDKKAYSEALLSCSVPRYMVAACPLAFGEVGVKERVKSVLNYKKPTFWIILIAVIALIVAAVCFLTDPVSEDEFSMSGSNVSDIDTQQILTQIRRYNGLEDNQNAYMNSGGFDILLDENFDFASASVQYFFYQEQKIYSSVLIFAPHADSFCLLGTEEWEDQESIFLLAHYLEALRTLPQQEIRALAPDADRFLIEHVEEGAPGAFDRVIRYSANGVEYTDGWLIHLAVTPIYIENGENREAGEEMIHLFYGDTPQSQAGGSVPFQKDALNYVKSSVEAFLRDGETSYIQLTEDAASILEAINWDTLEYTGAASDQVSVGYVFTVREPTVIDGKVEEYYTLTFEIDANGELMGITKMGPQRMAEEPVQGSDIVIPYLAVENGEIIPVLETPDSELYVQGYFASYYDGTERPGVASVDDSEMIGLAKMFWEIPESAWEDGLLEENYDEFCSDLTLWLAYAPSAEKYDLEAALYYTGEGVNLRFYEDGELLEDTYHIRYEPLNEFMESLCDKTRRTNSVHIMYPDTVMEYSHDDITVALQPMVGWEYEVVPYTDEDTPFGIRCRPEWEEEGWIYVSYRPGGFAACGTGLETVEHQWGWGDCQYNVVTGYFDGSENWSFIRFTDLPEDYVILNEGADAWFDRAEDIIFMCCGAEQEGILGYKTKLDTVEKLTGESSPEKIKEQIDALQDAVDISSSGG